jgi:hypothetical protein
MIIFLYFNINSFACRERLAIPISLLPGKASGVSSLNTKIFLFANPCQCISMGSLTDAPCYVKRQIIKRSDK